MVYLRKCVGGGRFDRNCAICLESLDNGEVVKIHSGRMGQQHGMHEHCWELLFASGTDRCPMCRARVRNISTASLAVLGAAGFATACLVSYGVDYVFDPNLVVLGGLSFVCGLSILIPWRFI